MCPMYRLRFDELFTDVQYWGVLCVVQVGYGLGGGGGENCSCVWLFWCAVICSAGSGVK